MLSRRLGLGALLALALAAQVAPPDASAVMRSGSNFSARNVIWKAFPIDDEPSATARDDRSVRESVITNPWGGGRFRIETLARPRPGGCTIPETLVFAAAYGSGECYPAQGQQSLTLVDQRLVPFKPVSTPHKYSAIGRGGDNLRGRRSVIQRVLQRRAKTLRNGSPFATKTAMYWSAALGLLENPLTSRRSRQIIITLLEADAGERAPVMGEDPRGRRSLLLTFNDSSHIEKFAIGADLYDLSDIRMRQNLYFAPKTYNIRASSTVLTATTEPSLQSWLMADGEAVIGQRIPLPTKQVVRRSLRQRRVSCKSLGVDSNGVCIDIGSPGGRYMTVGG